MYIFNTCGKLCPAVWQARFQISNYHPNEVSPTDRKAKKKKEKGLGEQIWKIVLYE
jgi:hypothetical protein